MATSQPQQPQQMGQTQSAPMQQAAAQPAARMQAQMGQPQNPVFTDFASI